MYTFTAFARIPDRHLYLHDDGYPAGAAMRFAAALREAADNSHFLSAFLGTQQQAEALTGLEQAADAEYRYRVRLLPGSDPQLEVHCWRRIPGNSWNLRCGPLPLDAFIRRFLPDVRDSPAGTSISAAEPPGEPPETPPARG